MAGLEEYLLCIYRYRIWLAVGVVSAQSVFASYPAYREITGYFNEKSPHISPKQESTQYLHDHLPKINILEQGKTGNVIENV